MKKSIANILITIVIIATFSGCGASSSHNLTTEAMPMPAASSAAPAVAADDYGRNAGFSNQAQIGGEAETPEMEEAVDMASDSKMVQPIAPPTGGGVAGPTVTPVIDSRKIIKNIDLQLQTLTFDKGVENIPNIVTSFGGFVENSYVQGRDMYNERGTRNANFTIRIPVEKLDAFVNSIGGEFHVISKSQNSQDITDTFYDSKARLDALKVQEERLLSMLKNAAELEYLLQVEKELMNVRYEIESLTSSLNRMNSQVSLSTVNLSLYEVVKYEDVKDVPVNFGQRISLAFSESWQNFLDFSQDFAVFFVSALPFLIVVAVIILIIVAIIRGNHKRHKRRMEILEKQGSQVYMKSQPAPQGAQPEVKNENPDKK